MSDALKKHREAVAPFVELQRKLAEQFHKAQLEAGLVLCPECGGEGELEYERAVVDWNNGGYLEGYMDTCDCCDGEGYVEGDE